MNAVTDIEREAAEWVVKFDDPNCTEEQRAELATWLAQSPEHSRQFRELRGVWNDIDGSGSPLPASNEEAGSLESDEDGLNVAEPADQAIDVARACKGVIRAYHERYASDAQDVKRLVQETYERLIATSASEPSRVRSVSEFLLTTARTLALDRLRQLDVIPMDRVADIEDLQTLDVGQQIHVIVSTNRIMSALATAFDSLAPRCREVFVLYKMHGYTCAQVSAHLGVSQRKVRKRLEEVAYHFEEALRYQNTEAAQY
jgi:RNA polymerase sigma-70 factor (ECF subfamily)